MLAHGAGFYKEIRSEKFLSDYFVFADIDVLEAYERIGFRLRHGIGAVKAHLRRDIVLHDGVQLMAERAGNYDDILCRVAARDHRTLDLLSSNFSCPRCYCND